MSFLYALESVRQPFLSSVMYALTYLGSEIAFMVVALVLYWCADKRHGLTVLCVGFFGTLANEFLKLAFRIPRPWVKDPSFTIVESAREGAGGYSFPSGHTATAAGCYGSLALIAKKAGWRFLWIALIVISGFSRLYLGVHTPADVAVGLIVGLVPAFVMWILFRRFGGRTGFRYLMLGIMLALSVAYTVYLELHAWPADIDTANLASGTKNGWTLMGSCAGMLIAVFADDRRLRFRTAAPLPGQILKVVIGLALTMVIRTVLKQPLNGLFGGSGAATAVRYFVMVLFAGAVWPLTFPLWEKVGSRKH